MIEIAEAVVAALVEPVAAMVPVVAATVPVGPGAALGRLGAPGQVGASGQVGMPGWPGAGQVPALFARRGTGWQAAPTRGSAPVGRGTVDSPVMAALERVGPVGAERVLGALELTVARLREVAVDVGGAVDLAPYLRGPDEGRRLVTFASSAVDSEAVAAARVLQQMRPDVTELALVLARRMAGRPSVAPLLVVRSDAGDERAIAAAHGAAYLALAVAVTVVVVARLPVRLPVDDAAAVVGTALGVAAVLLADVPMPAGYAEAARARVRAEYRLPLRAMGTVGVSGHRFALAEGDVPAEVDFGGNGLVAVVPGGAVIRTGMAEGRVHVRLTVLAEAPPVDPGWDEVVEVSWHAAEGGASVVGTDEHGAVGMRGATPPWPGAYRLRVHARGRDEAEFGVESYELVVWQAPAAAETVHGHTDRLGHRLRGEPEPVRAARPEDPYRWVARHRRIGEGATVTVATGTTVERVLRAFGADPARPGSLRVLEDEAYDVDGPHPWVAVVDAGRAVVAVEFNGYQGANGAVVARAGADGRAASMYWNANALTRLSFAEGGRVLASYEPMPHIEHGGGPEVAAALSGIDFSEYRDTAAKGLAAVERFTGTGITESLLARIVDADIAFRIGS